MEIIINNEKFNVDIANSYKEKLFGLMGKTNITTGLFFVNTRSIHTFFMKEEIDIIMINKNEEIVYYQKNCPKNKIIIKLRAHHTIELPKNSLHNISIGDKIIIKY